MAFFGGGASVDLASPSAIGSTTPNTGAFTTLSANNGTITTSSPAFTLAQTWNAAGVAFTAIQTNITSTAAASGSLFADFQVGGTSQCSIGYNGTNPVFNIKSTTSTVYSIAGNGAALLFYYGSDKTLSICFTFGVPGIVMPSNGTYGFGSGTDVSSGSGDVYLARDAANTLAQRRTTNAQTFRLYNTFTDASNYERASIGWTSNTFVISPEKAGTGSTRNAKYFLGHNGSSMTSFIEGYGTNGVNIATGGANTAWVFSGASTFTNEYTYGADVIIGARQVGGGNSNFSSPRLKLQGGAGTGNGTGGEVWAEGSLTRASGTTQHTVYELFRGYITTADQPMFSIGGKTSSFPALKRSSAVLQARLADDSGYTVLDAQLRAQGTAPATAGATGTAGDIRYDADYIYICTAANTWKRVAIATW